ncbi:O-succinylbenzoic acid--CoA ligase [Cytophagales bacterium WSM2-2]|nr:O-succinylbenzoic acid--CoA ligase [Cytophagales bacterium WSM2-2]
MAWLNLNGNLYSISDLKNSTPTGSSDFERSTLGFCKSWLNGQQEFVIQTSGSTGTPKKITLSRAAMEASAQQTIHALHLSKEGTALVCLDTKYIAGQMMLVRCLTLGMNIIANEPSGNPLENITSRIEFTALVPYQLENILDHTPGQLNMVHRAIIGGATVSQSLKEKMQKTSCLLLATYGMTETISHVALQKLNGPDSQDYFETLKNIHLRLDDRGCLCIKVDYLEGEIVTNDLVELVSSNKFKWLGRIDNVINSGGVKVIPEKVEAAIEKALVKLQIKARFFVAGLPDEKMGQRVVTIVEGLPDQWPSDKIMSDIVSNLTKYELPKEVKFVPKFIETPTGKINRAQTIATHLQQK